MAVFTDRIVLKNSSDSEVQIIQQIEAGGSDAIVPGEVVVGLTPGTARLYTLDANNDVVTLGGTAATSLAGLSDVDVTTNPPSPNQSLAWDASVGYWVPSTPVVGASALNELTDVDLTTNPPQTESLLEYNVVAGQWQSTNEIGPISMHRDVDLTTSPPQSGQSLIYDGIDQKWVPGVPNIIGLSALIDDPQPTLGGDLNLNGFSVTDSTGTVNILIPGVLPRLKVQSFDDTYIPGIDFLAGADRLLSILPNPLTDVQNPWSLVLPPDPGQAGYVLATTGSGTTTWIDAKVQSETSPTLGANLDVNGFSIFEGDFDKDLTLEAVTGTVEIKGIYDPRFLDTDPNRPDLLEAKLKLWDASQTNNVSISAGPALAQTWTMTLPEGPGTNGFALLTDGQGNTRWASGVAADISQSSITDLIDVDTQTDPPAVNEGLIWNGSYWVPGLAQADISAASIGDLSDVNAGSAEVNDVLVYQSNGTWLSKSIGIQDMDDYALEQTSALTWRYQFGSANVVGQWETDGVSAFSVSNQDANGNNFLSYMLGFLGSFPATLAVSSTGEVDSWTTLGIVAVVNNGDRFQFSVSPNNPISSGTLYLTLEAAPVSLPLEDGKVLTYSAAQNAFVPATNDSGTLDYNELENKPDIPSSIDDLTDVDTSSNPPAAGQVLEWSGTKWEPGDGQAASVELVQGQTGRVWLKIEDMLDFGDEGAPGVAFSFNKNIGEVNADYTQDGVWGPATGGNDLLVSATTSDGFSVAEIVEVLPATGNMWIYSSSTNFWAGPASYTSITENYLGTGAYNFAGVGAYFTSAAGADLQITFVNPNSLAQAREDGDVLTWNSVNNRFEPQPLDAAGDITAIVGGTFGSG